jgi:DNA-directed RNA polymerase III subunit RPC4
VYLDTHAGDGKTKKTMTVLGEVNRRFIVSPDVDVLLEQVDTAEAVVTKSELDAHELLPMDVDD